MNAHKQLAKLNKHSTVSALVLTVALLCGIVGLGLYSVMAEPNGGYKVSDLEVRQGEDRQWYAYEKGTTTKATTYYGVVPNSYGWWRVEAGKVNFNRRTAVPSIRMNVVNRSPKPKGRRHSGCWMTVKSRSATVARDRAPSRTAKAGGA